MTDIRKHGFESDAQWQEYLAEAEEAATAAGRGGPARAGVHPAVRPELARLRAQVEELRDRLHARQEDRRHKQHFMLAVGAGALLLAAMAIVRPAIQARGRYY